MIRIYRADTALLPDEDAVLEKMVFLDETRKRKVWQCKNLEDKKRSLLAGYLIQQGVKEWMTKEGGLQGDAKPLFLTYDYSRYGKPYFKGEKGLYFNISHSKSYVVCAFSDKEVGIDIQIHRKGKADIAWRFFSMEDRALMESLAGGGKSPEEIFFALWTVKEAFMKLTGEGLRQGLDATVIEMADDGGTGLGECPNGMWKQGRIRKREEKDGAYFQIYEERNGISKYSMALCSYEMAGEIQRKEVRI